MFIICMFAFIQWKTDLQTNNFSPYNLIIAAAAENNKRDKDELKKDNNPKNKEGGGSRWTSPNLCPSTPKTSTVTDYNFTR